MHSFLLIGQSNMAGRGFFHEVAPLDNDRIYVLRNGRWQPIFFPVHNDRAFAGVCLAESFADEYSKSHQVDVGLIPCADGGTCLDQWKKGSLLYDNAIYQAKLAMRTSNLAGVLWHQGEADCTDEKHLQYTDKFIEMLHSFYDDLSLEGIPFLVGGLGDYFLPERYPDIARYCTSINQQLKSLAKNNALVEYVSADGLAPNPDGLHFNAKSLREFGIRYHDAFLKAENPQKHFQTITDGGYKILNPLEQL